MNPMTIAEAYRIVAKDNSERESIISAIEQHTGATRKSILRKLGQLETEVTAPEEEPEDFTSPTVFESVMNPKGLFQEEEIPMEDSVNLALMRENSRLKGVVKKLSTERGGQNRLLEEISQQVRSINSLPMVYKPKNENKDTATLCLLLCDWHCGQKSYVPQINRFDYNALVSRVDRLIYKVLDWVELHRNSYKIDEICLLCAGDFISGDIHDELIRTNEFSSPEQVVRVSELLGKVISSFSPHFRKVRIEFVVHDNHSRCTDKPSFSDATSCFNYIVGHLTKALVKNISNVEFNLYPSIQQIVSVQKRKYLVMHGNCIRGGANGVPLVAINKRVWRESFLRLNLPDETRFDKIVMAHYHSLTLTDEVILGPSIAGTANYDEASARVAKSAQLAWLVSGRYEFDFIEFYLNEGEKY